MSDYGRRGKMVRRRIANADGSGTAKTMWWFLCPGCDDLHGFEEPRWARTGTDDAPTFTPSLLVRYHGADGDRRCHLFLRGGVLEFLSDCTHALAGQKVPLLEPPEWLLDDDEEAGP